MFQHQSISPKRVKQEFKYGSQLQTYNAHKVSKNSPQKGRGLVPIYRLPLNGLGENGGLKFTKHAKYCTRLSVHKKSPKSICTQAAPDKIPNM